LQEDGGRAVEFEVEERRRASEITGQEAAKIGDQANIESCVVERDRKTDCERIDVLP
jgi:hypothetical protein